MKKKYLSFLFLFSLWNMNSQILLSNNFDSSNANGWTVTHTSGTSTSLGWFLGVTGASNPTATPYLGTGMAGFASYSIAAGNIYNLITPSIAFAGDNYKVRFYMYRDNGYPTDADKIEVLYNTSTSLTGASLLGTVNRSRTLSPTVTTNGWYKYEFSLPANVSGNGYIIFKATSAYGNNILLDEVTVYKPAANDAWLKSVNVVSPQAPGNINITGTLNNFGTAAINSLEIKWNVNGGSDNTQTITGLNIATGSDYNFTHNIPWNATSGSYNLNVTVSTVNGQPDPNNNNSISKIIEILHADNVGLEEITHNRYSLTNTNNTIDLNISNYGHNPITSLQVNWNDGTDHISTIPVTGLDTYGSNVTISHPMPITYSSLVDKNIAVTIQTVNSNTDPIPSNNSKNSKFNTISQDSPKKVVVEEGTGTWCQYCPRGAVAMDYMYTNYPNDFIGIAVHNGDPMTLTEYDNGADFSGFPSMNVDRKLLDEGVSQSSMEALVDTRKTLKVPANISLVAQQDGSNISLTITSIFRANFANANFKFGIIISEDDVTGTTSGYNQVNYYSGGAAGPMGGYENLPNPVPAADMVYNHVGRALLGGYSGMSNSIPAVIIDGQSVSYTFNYTLPTGTNLADFTAVGVIIDGDTNEIVNAKNEKINAILGANDFSTIDFNFYPNPSNGSIRFETQKELTVSIVDMLGKTVYSKAGILDGNTLEISNLNDGVYMLNVSDGVSISAKKLVIKK